MCGRRVPALDSMPYGEEGSSRSVDGYPEERRRSWLIGYACYKSHIREDEQVSIPDREERAERRSNRRDDD